MSNYNEVSYKSRFGNNCNELENMNYFVPSENQVSSLSNDDINLRKHSDFKGNSICESSMFKQNKFVNNDLIFESDINKYKNIAYNKSDDLNIKEKSSNNLPAYFYDNQENFYSCSNNNNNINDEVSIIQSSASLTSVPHSTNNIINNSVSLKANENEDPQLIIKNLIKYRAWFDQYQIWLNSYQNYFGGNLRSDSKIETPANRLFFQENDRNNEINKNMHPIRSDTFEMEHFRQNNIFSSSKFIDPDDSMSISSFSSKCQIVDSSAKVNDHLRHRSSPLLFAIPHSRVNFTNDGKLIVISSDSTSLNQLSSISIVTLISSDQYFIEQFPGPLFNRISKSESEPDSPNKFIDIRIKHFFGRQQFEKESQDNLLLWMLISSINSFKKIPSCEEVSKILDKFLPTALNTELTRIARPSDYFEDHLICGRIKEAIEESITCKQWGSAFILSSYDQNLFSNVCQKFIGDHSCKDHSQTFYRCMLGYEIDWNDIDWLVLIKDWPIHLKLILRASNYCQNGQTSSQLINFGRHLWKNGNWSAGQFTLLLAGILPNYLINNPTHSYDKFLLFGLNNQSTNKEFNNLKQITERTNKFKINLPKSIISEDVLQLNEILEFCIFDNSDSMKSLRMHLLPYKLMYGISLWSRGYMAVAIDYFMQICEIFFNYDFNDFSPRFICRLYWFGKSVKFSEDFNYKNEYKEILDKYLLTLQNFMFNQTANISNESQNYNLSKPGYITAFNSTTFNRSKIDNYHISPSINANIDVETKQIPFEQQQSTLRSVEMFKVDGSLNTFDDFPSPIINTMNNLNNHNFFTEQSNKKSSNEDDLFFTNKPEQSKKLNNNSNFVDQKHTESFKPIQNVDTPSGATNVIDTDSNSTITKQSSFVGGLLQKLIPSKKNQVFLPDDKEKSLVYDENLGRWVNKSEPLNQFSTISNIPPPQNSDYTENLKSVRNLYSSKGNRYVIQR